MEKVNKEEFNGLEVEEQVKVVNKYIEVLGSLTKAVKEIGMAKTTVRDRFTKIGYKLIEGQYRKVDDTSHINVIKDIDDKSHAKVIKSVDDKSHTKVTDVKKADDKIHTKVADLVNQWKVTDDTSHNKVIKKDDEDSMTRVIKEYDVIPNEQIKENLLGLIANYSKINEIISWYESMQDKPQEIKIELPGETKENFRTTIRVNNVVYEEFESFCSKHKEYTKKDLLSQALKEYIERY